MQPTDVSGTALTVTPQDLRDAGAYLIRHGWYQGGLFDRPGVATPRASVRGAIRMVVLGHPDWRASRVLPVDECMRITFAEGWLAGFLMVHRKVTSDFGRPNWWLVQQWNDQSSAVRHILAGLDEASALCQQCLDGNR
jgi:hypothetical protein